MFGFTNNTFLLGGIIMLLGSMWTYKIYNPRVWGPFTKKKGFLGGLSKIIFNLEKLDALISFLLGLFLLFIGLYGTIYDIHDTDEKEIKDIFK